MFLGMIEEYGPRFFNYSLDKKLISTSVVLFAKMSTFMSNVHLLCMILKDHRGNLCKDPSRETFNPFPNKPWFLRVCSTSL